MRTLCELWDPSLDRGDDCLLPRTGRNAFETHEAGDGEDEEEMVHSILSALKRIHCCEEIDDEGVLQMDGEGADVCCTHSDRREFDLRQIYG